MDWNTSTQFWCLYIHAPPAAQSTRCMLEEPLCATARSVHNIRIRKKKRKKKLGFHEMCHESQTALDWALRNKDKVKFKHLGNQFAINSWQQQVILPLANTLCYRRNCFSPLHPSPSPTHTHEPQVDCAVMLTGEENCFLTFPVINLHPEAWDWFHFSVYM